jgi:hypothetical protein
MRKLKLIQETTAALLTIAMFAGCGGGSRKDDDVHKRDALRVQTAQIFNLNIGQIAWIESEDLYIEFIDITEDSRCPVGVICVWEGQATALLGFYKDDKTHAEYSVTSRAGHPELAVTEFDNYVISLEKLLPKKIAGETIELSEYVIKLKISFSE